MMQRIRCLFGFHRWRFMSWQWHYGNILDVHHCDPCGKYRYKKGL